MALSSKIPPPPKTTKKKILMALHTVILDFFSFASLFFSLSRARSPVHERVPNVQERKRRGLICPLVQMARNGRGGAGRKTNGAVDEVYALSTAGATEPSTSTSASPLLRQQQPHDSDNRSNLFPTRRPLLEEALALFSLALPLSCDQAGSFAASVVSAAVVARSSLGASQTAALFLGRSLVSITGLAPVLGSLSAIETFAGAAHGAANADEARERRRAGEEDEEGGDGGGRNDGDDDDENDDNGENNNATVVVGARAALGSVLQRALLAAFALSAAASLLWTARRGAAGRFVLVRVLGQDPEISAPAARFAARWPPALFLWAVSEACRRTAVAQGAVRACACVSLLMLLTAGPLTRFLVTGRGIVGSSSSSLASSSSSSSSSSFSSSIFSSTGLGLGLDGSDAADAGMALLSAAGMALVVLGLDSQRPSKSQRAWHGFSRDALCSLEAWRAHVKLAAPAAVLVCASWWAGQAAVVIAGRLPDGQGSLNPMTTTTTTTSLFSLLSSSFSSPSASTTPPPSLSATSSGASLAAAGVLLNVRAASYMMADGVASAAAVRVANDLGAGDWRRARLAARLAAATGALLGLAAAAAAVGRARSWSVALCPSENACSEIVVKAAPFLGIAMAVEAAAGAAGGALRGCGRQATAVGVSLAGAWALGLPLQAWLALRPPAFAVALGAGPGVPGLLAGAAMASCCLFAALAAVVSRLDWAREARRAAVAVEVSGSTSGSAVSTRRRSEGGGGVLREPLLVATSAAGE